jgi:hypothetical protein
MLQSAPNLIRRLSWGMVSVVFIVGAVALVRDTVYQGQDFEVFWKTARFVLGGNPAYDPSRDGAMVFKYPPWIIPAFFPFATLSLSFGKWIWGVIQVFSLAYSAYWLIQRGCRAWVVVGGVLLFWGVWAVHALDGQITVCVLALSLWAMEKEGTARAVLLVWGLSVKIFSVFALIGARRRIMSLSTVVVVCGSLSALSVPACLSEPSKNPINLVKNWSLAARSAGERFEDEKIRGRENQGFPALVLRMSGVPARESHFDLGVAFSRAASCDYVVGLACFGSHDSSAGMDPYLCSGVPTLCFCRGSSHRV